MPNFIAKLLNYLKTIFSPPKHDTSKIIDDDIAHQRAVTKRLITWLDENNLKYSYQESEDDEAVYFLMLGFVGDDDYEWNCVFRINERNKLVNIYGIIPFVIPQDYYAEALAILANINQRINFGNVELDLQDGEVRFKTFFDAEFTTLSSRNIDSYVHGTSIFTKLAFDTMSDLLSRPARQSFDEILASLHNDNQTENDNTDSDFIVPSQAIQ